MIKDNLDGIQSIFQELVQQNISVEPKTIDKLLNLELNLGNVNTVSMKWTELCCSKLWTLSLGVLFNVTFVPSVFAEAFKFIWR